jgi:hypothetical protein
MARNEQDPAANTQQFRAFASRGDAAGQRTNTGLIITIVVAGLLVAIAVIALLVVG